MQFRVAYATTTGDMTDTILGKGADEIGCCSRYLGVRLLLRNLGDVTDASPGPDLLDSR